MKYFEIVPFEINLTPERIVELAQTISDETQLRS